MAQFGVEPFEEATQSQDSESTAASPDALKAFYAKMEQQEILERKMSRKQSTTKRFLWSRKSTKKQLGTPINNVPVLGKLPSPVTDSDQEKGLDEENDQFDDKTDLLMSPLSRSIIPDALGELPAWFIKENELAIGQTTSYRIKYPIHSPFGPRYYKNQHLIPTSQLRAAARPPSVFSPSFPPMTASSHDQAEESTSRPGLSRTPSGSPLATPTSSQADVAAKPRSRKTSQTTPDTVDLLDVTDPWGTHYHHQSPYDPGLTSSSSHGSHVEAEAPESPMSPRSRRSSVTARRKVVSPSPLSQSTSALHMPAPDIGPQLTRKLSKRRKPLMGGLFNSPDKEQDKDSDESLQQAASVPRAASAPLVHAESAPVTPVDAPTTTRSSTMPNGLHPAGDLNKRYSAVPPSMPSNPHGPVATHHLGEKKEKRGSVLGRLAKKLSIMKRPTELVRGSIGSTDEWQHIGMGDAQSDRNSGRVQRHSMQDRPSMEQRKTDPIKRVPPPTVGIDSSSGRASDTPPARHSEDHRSITSLEPPLAMGKLTITNPDSPSSADNTPVGPNVPLPANPESVPEVTSRLRALQDPAERPKSTLPPLPDSASNYDRASQGTVTPMLTPTMAERPPTPPRRPSSAEIPQSPTSIDPMSLYATYVNGLASPSVIPFPITDQRPSSSISTSARATVASSTFVEDSPLSRASLIVNPPTPHNVIVPIAPTPVVPTSASLPAIPTASERPSRNPSPTKVEAPKPKLEVTKPKADVEVKDDPQRGSTPVTSRQTETFKLIRTASGNVLPANETITAGGEHWEVVESSDSSKKNKTRERSSRSKDRDTGGRKEQRRQGHSAPQETETDHRRTRQRSISGKGVDQSPAIPPPTKSTRSQSMDIPLPSQEDSKHNRKEPKPNLDKPQPPPPPPTPGPSRVERKPSTSVRPTSELAPAAELNALRAREAWDMDRLWKGKSMYYPEPELKGTITAPPQAREPKGATSSVSAELTRDNGTVRSSGHGSSHTSFMVQPFQGHAPANMYYSNMPSAPPPTIYSPTTLQQAPFPSSVPYEYPQSYRPFPSFSLPPQEPLPEVSTRSNPLPPPPRESSYQPSPLSPLSDSSGRSNADHWIRHPGVTTAH
ncbi:hypothetical protein PILCRDRAFT_813547 [Piloderma croceum F 1598]|uniref:Uncharacterized protein n=1 Tax=Piloderma croceum (strain F 1598) TaxID=765440 RepID=A0A0C3GA25_PILCF|nr:hypothetical protein PILCRDRAFT_813547 [Piloderma croceum F 1598]